ncbi:Stress responsive A/B Barrel Domain [Prosthecobacter debontii]|uniref:Stress responsive A/B Barrel Domain n=1 Tax=Prosthecobacter debontii TaxID=48467 RepID=A0A1T4XZY4_9BACT|nr:Dabb family protein [Prosthecobacter debontii]SKA95147.1 Stress responsive A/B Barrel Domain [Prosthecobacter debontii]
MKRLHISPLHQACLALLTLGVMLMASCSSATLPQGKLHQVGFVWLKNPQDRSRIIEAVHDFGKHIPEVRSAAVGTPMSVGSRLADTSYDVAFVLTFDDDAARQRYAAHPVHEKAAQEVFLPLSRKLLFYHFTDQ